ncbi:hypothetical protein DNAM5_114 [Haloarcula californiae tailed virus 1]|uniref:Uncharacterized protein n=1 Tax=Haloarcula californiae tailed virus 1 TaxID=1273746 RepID=R4TP20_9CAUD|nr:hypothetical protein M202_gp105 [Haloarcula californiae tailed virus 1]AGM11973.1 hypothetical protein DNAM5_114 [Haloarcula californiae tailed virus 1]
MAKTVTIDDTEYMGAVTTRFVTVDVSSYSGGEGFVPADVNMRRFQAVTVEVADGTGYSASYDEGAEAIRLYESAGASGEMAEVTSVANSPVTLRVTCMGR